MLFKPSLIQESQLDVLVLLRGIAVIMVCFCHFGDPLSEGHAFAGLFKWFDDYGKYGVHVFFVISGFIIPLSLLKGRYHINDYTRFLHKRVLRLHPPYLAALALTLAIMFLSYKVRKADFPENASSIFESLWYYHVPSDNPVFWTLAVEAQYYLFIGIFYILLIHYPKPLLFIGIPLLAILSQTGITDYIALFSYIIFFLVGTVGFLIYSNIGNKLENIVVLAALLMFSAFFYELPAFLTSLITIVTILKGRIRVPQVLQFPGKISYTIYLIHFPIGVKFINLLKPRMNPSYSWLLFLVSVIIVFTASWVFYYAFEKYSESMSRKIKYKAIQPKSLDFV
jgi:peptidoglycan/LPS O-acetylase OafA/YrhL